MTFRFDHLREASRNDVLTHIKTPHGRQRHDQLVTWGSLLTRAERNGPIFRN
ncbi:hypothetical protein ACWD5Q_05935 [Streptomyces sp. NPDC002513]